MVESLGRSQKKGKLLIENLSGSREKNVRDHNSLMESVGKDMSIVFS